MSGNPWHDHGNRLRAAPARAAEPEIDTDMTFDDIAQQWLEQLADLGPLPADVVADTVVDLVAHLRAGLARPAFEPAMAEQAGAGLVAAGITAPAALGTAVPILRTLAETARPGDTAAADTVIGGFCTGFARALQSSTPYAEGFELAFRHTSIGISLGDEHGHILDANPAFERLVGRTVEELRSTDGFMLFPPERRAEVQELVESALEASPTDTLHVEGRFPRGDGSMVWTAWTVIRCSSAGGDRRYLLGFGEDITERRTATEQLQWQAMHDPLTALPNRRHLLDRLHTVIADAAPDAVAGVLALDLNNFKEVNDSFGHIAGDRLLAEVSARLEAAATRHRCLLARTGGDEFIVLAAPPADNDHIDSIVTGMHRALAQPFTVDGARITVAVSIGAVLAPMAGADADAVLDRADRALYAAKTSGSTHTVRR